MLGNPRSQPWSGWAPRRYPCPPPPSRRARPVPDLAPVASEVCAAHPPQGLLCLRTSSVFPALSLPVAFVVYGAQVSKNQDDLVSANSFLAFQFPTALGYFLCVSLCVLSLVAQSCLTLCDPVDCSPPGFPVHGDSPYKNTGVGCHALLQGIFLTQGLNPRSPALQADSLLAELPGKPCVCLLLPN